MEYLVIPYRLVIPMQSQADALSGQCHAHQMHSQASATPTKLPVEHMTEVCHRMSIPDNYLHTIQAWNRFFLFYVVALWLLCINMFRISAIATRVSQNDISCRQECCITCMRPRMHAYLHRRNQTQFSTNKKILKKF